MHLNEIWQWPVVQGCEESEPCENWECVKGYPWKKLSRVGFSVVGLLEVPCNRDFLLVSGDHPGHSSYFGRNWRIWANERYGQHVLLLHECNHPDPPHWRVGVVPHKHCFVFGWFYPRLWSSRTWKGTIIVNISQHYLAPLSCLLSLSPYCQTCNWQWLSTSGQSHQSERVTEIPNMQDAEGGASYKFPYESV